MTRQYAELWSKIARREIVTVVCHKSHAQTLKKALQKEKWLIKRARNMTGLPSFGTMTIKEIQIPDKPTHIRLEFSLTYSGENL
jgi:hypothetical protein